MKNKILLHTSLQKIPFIFLLGILPNLAHTAPAHNGEESDALQCIEVSAYVQKKYHKDAVRLALRLNSDQKNYHALDIDLPENTVQSIFHALVSIHESNLPEAVLVTQSHKVHTFPTPTVDRFFMIYDKKVDWAKSIKEDTKEIKNKKLESLIEKYGLVIDRNSEWDEEFNSLHIRANEPLNIARLVEEFRKVKGVHKIDLLQPDGDGNDIEIKATDAGWMVNYVIKFDSCINDCKKRHFWSFEVNRQGDVIFLGEFGDELPEWMQVSPRPFAGNH